jgi:regulatory protein
VQQDVPQRPSAEEEYERAREICLRQLSYSARTRAQLASAMRRRGIEDGIAADILSRFEAVGLVDDEAFAAAWVDSRHRGRGVGPRKLEHELRHRGVDQRLTAESLSTITPEEERATARALIQVRLAGTRRQPAQRRARRLAGILARKGYSPQVAYDVVREALAAEGEELPDVIESLPDSD